MALIDDIDGLQSIYINRATGNGNDDDERGWSFYLNMCTFSGHLNSFKSHIAIHSVFRWLLKAIYQMQCLGAMRPFIDPINQKG